MATIIHRVGSPANLEPEQVDANFDALNADAANALATANGKVSPGLITASGLTVSADARIVGRAAGVAGAGPLQELAVGPGLTLVGGVLDVDPDSSAAQAYTELTDATSVDLPTVNGPLSIEFAQVRAEMAAIVGSPPTALNTLDEIAAALGDDANFAATVATALGTKITAKANYTLTTATALTEATHSNAHGTSASASPLTHTAPLTAAEGQWLEIFNGGPAAMTMGGVTADTGYTNVAPAGATYEALFTLGAWHSQLQSGGGGGGSSTLIDGGSATSDYTGVLAIDGGTATT